MMVQINYKYVRLCRVEFSNQTAGQGAQYLHLQYMEEQGSIQNLYFQVDRPYEIEMLINAHLVPPRATPQAVIQPQPIRQRPPAALTPPQQTQIAAQPKSYSSSAIMAAYIRLNKDAAQSKASTDAYLDYLNKLRYKDSVGRIWTIGKESGKWYYFEGGRYKEG